MKKSPAKISTKDAAYAVMESAYLKASRNNTLPANARQIMYAARPKILRRTGLDKLSDTYFIKTLLPDYMRDHPEQTATWDVAYDARGHHTEPHTGKEIGLGTLAVREYLQRISEHTIDDIIPKFGGQLYPTMGPKNRYSAILFIEKEGFMPLFEKVRLADFHSLRHTFISNLTKGGASPKVAQSLARHSTIGLTMDTYTHIGLFDERAALDSLPELPSLDESKNHRSNKAVALKTGTDDLPAMNDKSAYKPAYKKLTKNAYFDKSRLSANVNKSNNVGGIVESDKSLSTGMLGSENNQMSLPDTDKNKRSRRDSNPRYLSVQRFSRPSP